MRISDLNECREHRYAAAGLRSLRYLPARWNDLYNLVPAGNIDIQEGVCWLERNGLAYMSSGIIYRTRWGDRAVDHPMIGHRHGWLTVLSRAEYSERRISLMCQCDCGIVKPIRASAILKGASRSCGCKRSYFARLRHTKHGKARYGVKCKEYLAWKRLRTKSKCLGQKVSERWETFQQFYLDLGTRPKGHCLRKFPDGHPWGPHNVRWDPDTRVKVEGC